MPNLPINVTSTSNNMDTLSRNELILWINEALDLQYTKIEQMCSGAAYCQMLHILYPNKLPMKKVKFDAKLEHTYIDNWKVLQDAFKKLHIEKDIPIQRLVKGRFQDNFEFLQWFYKFYTINDDGIQCQSYDPAAVRSDAGTGTGTKTAASPAKRQQPPVKRAAAAAPSGPTMKNSGSGSSVKKTGSKNNYNEEVVELREKLEELTLTVEGLEKERDFYFSKLRDIEVICQEKEGDEAYAQFVEAIISVLYATEDGFGPAEEELDLEDCGALDDEVEQEEY